MFDSWDIKLYLLTLAIVVGALGILGLLTWLIIYLIRRIGFRPTSEHWEGFIEIIIALGLLPIAILTPIPTFLDIGTWFQIYLLILTITIPATVFILQFAAQRIELTHPFDALYRLTHARAIIFDQLFVLLGLLFLLLIVDNQSMHKTLQLISLWAAMLSTRLFIGMFNSIKDSTRIQEMDLNISEEKLHTPLDRLGIGTPKTRTRDERE